MTSASEARIRACGPEDRPSQIDLYQRCFGQDGTEVLPWRYDRSPHGEAVALVADDENGKPVSGYASMPRQVVPGGDESQACLVGQTGDVMTDASARGKGLFSELDEQVRQTIAAKGWVAQFGLPNSTSSEIFVGKLGWTGAARIRPYTFVLTGGADARAERMKAGRLASALVPWALWRGTMSRGKLRKSFFEKVNVVAIPRFREEVDEVWRHVAKDWPWMVRRDATYLNWRFLEAPSGRFRAHGVFAPSGEMRGYCVVQLPTKDDRVGYIMDVLAYDDVALAAAIEAGLGHLLKAGASVARANAIEGSWWERKLLWAGFQAPKKEDHKRVIVRVLDEAHPAGKAAKDPASWYFTDADREDELVR